jgi:hypothetical protein
MLSTDTVITRLLERIPLAIVATPEYLKKCGLPRHPSELAEQTFVAMSPSLRKPELTFRLAEQNLSVPLSYEISSNNPIFNREMVVRAKVRISAGALT